MQVDQRWETKTMGCVDNLLIDKIFVNCGTGRFTLTKELTLQLGGFEETLEIHGIHFSLINRSDPCGCWCAWCSEEGYGRKHQESIRESYYVPKCHFRCREISRVKQENTKERLQH